MADPSLHPLNIEPDLSESAEFVSTSSVPKKPWGCPPDSDNKKVQWGCHPKTLDDGNPLTIDAQQKYIPRAAAALQNRWIFSQVPDYCRNWRPPYPLYKRTRDRQEFLCFFTKIYAFSNHFLVSLCIDGVEYCCSEQFYMYKKSSLFGFTEAADEIMSTNDTSTIKRLGTADTLRARQAAGLEPKSRNFDHDEWKKVKEEVMLNALRAKFVQNSYLSKMLVETRDALLVEASPTDKYWGIGCAIDSSEIEDQRLWKGENRLGILMMRIRQELQWK